MNETFDEFKFNIAKFKKDGKLTDKIRVYLLGFLSGLIDGGVITVEQSREIETLAETDKADPWGAAELIEYGDLFDFKDSKLEFD